MEPPLGSWIMKMIVIVSKRDFCSLSSLSLVLSPFFLVLGRREEIKKNGTIVCYCSGEVNMEMFRTARS